MFSLWDCFDDIQELIKEPYIINQLSEIDNNMIKEELKEYGAWSTEELENKEENKIRLLWIACCDIKGAYKNIEEE